MRKRLVSRVGAMTLVGTAGLILLGLAARRAGWPDPPAGWPRVLAVMSFAVAAVIEFEP